MPGFEQRASILRGAGAMIFSMVCERSTPEQWAEWLRVPLEHAAGTANADLVDKLLKAGADGSAGWKGCDGRSLLHAGAEGGNEQVVSALIRAGAKGDIDTKALAKRRTPLHLAALGGKVAAAKTLMVAGADVNILDASKEGPLHLAIRGGNAGLAEILLVRGADANVKSSLGSFPIHLAAGRGQDGLVRNLLHTGMQADCLDDDRWTPLFVAVDGGHLSTVKVLLDGGADSSVLCGVKFTAPLHTAVRKDSTGILTALVEAEADIEARSEGGFAPLHWAAFFGSCAAMLALLRLGANVDAKTTHLGSTPLHLACKQGQLDAADLLLRWGADETNVDNNGRTPSARIPSIAEAAEQDRPRLERLSKLLASAPQDRAWRRRGMLVLCRAHPDRLRLAVDISDTAEASGQPHGRPSRRARRGQVKVEVTMSSPQHGGAAAAGSTARVGGGMRAARQGSDGGGGGGFDGVAAWLVALEEEDVFRRIMGFL